MAFSFLSLFCLLAFVIGMIRPKAVIRWGARRTRAKVTMVYGIGFMVSFVLVGITAPKQPVNSMTGATAKNQGTGADSGSVPFAFVNQALHVSSNTKVLPYKIKTLSRMRNVWNLDADVAQSITKQQAAAIAAQVIRANWPKYDGIMITVRYERPIAVKVQGQKQIINDPVDVFNWKAARTTRGAQVEGYGGVTLPFFKDLNPQ